MIDEEAKRRFFAKTKLADTIRPVMTTPCLEWTAGLALVLLFAVLFAVLAASCATGITPPPDTGNAGGTLNAASLPGTGGSLAAGGAAGTGGAITTGGVVATGGTVTTGGTTAVLTRDAAPLDAHDWAHCPEAVVTVDDSGWTMTNTGPGVVWSDWSTLPYDHITPKGCPTGLTPAPGGGQDSLARSCIPSDWGATTLVLTIHCRDPGQLNDRAIEVRDYPVQP